jgi:pyruvate,orthophosphate dikinase
MDMRMILSDSAFSLQESLSSLSAQEKVRAIVAAAQAKTITRDEAILLTDESCINGIEYAAIALDDIDFERIVIRDFPGAPGASTGLVATSLAQAKRYADTQQPFILYVPTTDQNHVACIEGKYCVGVVTETGSASTHTTVITSRAGKPAVIGVGKIPLTAGETLTIDGTRGLIIRGEIAITKSDPDNESLRQIAAWAQEVRDRPDLGARKMHVKVNSYNPDEIAHAIKDGAEGVGAVQTEYMFAGNSLSLMQTILSYPLDDAYLSLVSSYCKAPSEEGMQAVLQYQRNKEYPYQDALDMLFSQQKDAFKKILISSGGLPVSVRLLDAPLKEFAPSPEQAEELCRILSLSGDQYKKWAASFEENNPIMGFRGTQFGIARPEVYRTQVRALLTAAQELQEEGHTIPEIDIMLTLISTKRQIELAQSLVDDTARECNSYIPFKHSIMMETPWACWRSGDFAKYTNDFSVGTNDLTGFTLGISREGGLEEYAQCFFTLDEAVASLLEEAVIGARAVNPNVRFKICGEHAADRASMVMFQRMGVDFLSVSAQKVRRTEIQTAQVFLERCFELESVKNRVVEFNSER